MIFFFFFQAEDGIRDWSVTGVQTCALPISTWPARGRTRRASCARSAPSPRGRSDGRSRSEERRVGKEGRSRWSPDHEKKKTDDERSSPLTPAPGSGRAVSEAPESVYVSYAQ